MLNIFIKIAMFIMGFVGVDFKEPNFSFGPKHKLYWEFEKIMIPAMIIICSLFCSYSLSMESMDLLNIPKKWLSISLSFGIIIMFCQFFLDYIILIKLMKNDFAEYFLGMVTIM
jgi:hypothetical protein